MLEIRSVRKLYDDRVVVNDVSFEVKPGEIFALLRPERRRQASTLIHRMITDIIDAGRRPDPHEQHSRLAGSRLPRGSRTCRCRARVHRRCRCTRP